MEPEQDQNGSEMIQEDVQPQSKQASPSLEQPIHPEAQTTAADQLPADIEHILSLGANEDDDVGKEGKEKLDGVVRELKLKAGMAMEEDKLVVLGENAQADVQVTDKPEEDLNVIEQEMEAGGIVREENAGVKEEIPEESVEDGPKHTVKMEDSSSESDSDSSSSSSSSSSDSDSNSDSPKQPDVANQPRQKNRKRPQKGKKAARPSDDDMSDDDVNGPSTRSAPKTEHEIDAPEIVAPDLERMPEGSEIAMFGKIESVISTVVVIKANTSGDWRVLDEGTVCCWEDRSVIGSIFETFGSVIQPFYSLRFPAASPPDPTVFTVGRNVYYCPNLASFVFTRDIRGLKGSDASNIWDEEVGAGEIEFSDDEAEAEYKRSLKVARKARAASSAAGSSNNRRNQAPRAPSQTSGNAAHQLPPRPAVSAYDDDSYTPLQRPRDLHLIGTAPPPGREARRMFERDTGNSGIGEAEFEFSDDGEEDGDSDEEVRKMLSRPAPTTGRSGGDRGRGRGQSHGGDGRGGRGRGRGGGCQGRGRGGGQGSREGDGRPMAALPSRGNVSRPAGLPPKPTFATDMPDLDTNGNARAPASSFSQGLPAASSSTSSNPHPSDYPRNGPPPPQQYPTSYQNPQPYDQNFGFSGGAPFNFAPHFGGFPNPFAGPPGFGGFPGAGLPPAFPPFTFGMGGGNQGAGDGGFYGNSSYGSQYDQRYGGSSGDGRQNGAYSSQGGQGAYGPGGQDYREGPGRNFGGGGEYLQLDWGQDGRRDFREDDRRGDYRDSLSRPPGWNQWRRDDQERR
ncbi:NAF1-domain-containing protein [Meredithblackwellia eburnea MCA 4105]